MRPFFCVLHKLKTRVSEVSSSRTDKEGSPGQQDSRFIYAVFLVVIIAIAFQEKTSKRTVLTPETY